MEQDVRTEEPADAAAAFEALRREVALLNVAVARLAAERASAPDYSETLSEIAEGVSVAVGRLGKVMVSPALATSPTEMAQTIAVAGEAARRQDRLVVHQAIDALQRGAQDLRGWVDSARLASVQNWRLVQALSAGVVVGAVLGLCLPDVVAQAAPARWALPERRAARALHSDLWSAGERLMRVSDPARFEALLSRRNDSRSAGNRNEPQPKLQKAHKR
jgi:hypothetical protein